MSTVALSIGSNLGDREAALVLAVRRFAELPGVADVRTSSVYETDPVGGVEQPDFLNIVVVGEMTGADAAGQARQLLDLARTVEEELDRVRVVRWGPRTVDVDILAVGDLGQDDPELTVPHPRIGERAFVLVPWAEVDPIFEVPGLGRVAELLAALPPEEVAGVRRCGPPLQDRTLDR